MKKDILNYLINQKENLLKQWTCYNELRSLNENDYSIIESIIEIESKIELINSVLIEFTENA